MQILYQVFFLVLIQLSYIEYLIAMKYDGSLLFTMFVNTVRVVYTTKLILECELDFSLKTVSPRRSHAYRSTFQYDYFHSMLCKGVVIV